MPKKATITEDQKDLVVKLYRDGKKWADIANEVGIQQPNIGWILNERGERRNRRKAPSEELTVAQVLERALHAEREASRYQTLYESERMLNERLVEELARARFELTGSDATDPRRINRGRPLDDAHEQARHLLGVPSDSVTEP